MPCKTKELQRAYQLNWVTARRRKYIAQLGACFFCGSHDNIEIHHIDPDKKEGHAIWSWTESRIQNELRKCVALCRPCHIKFHSLKKRISIKHGTRTAYKYGCRCEECKKDHAEAATRYNRTGTTRKLQPRQVG